MDNSGSGRRFNGSQVITKNHRSQCPCCAMIFVWKKNRGRHLVEKHGKTYNHKGQLADASKEEMNRYQQCRSRDLVLKQKRCKRRFKIKNFDSKINTSPNLKESVLSKPVETENLSSTEQGCGGQGSHSKAFTTNQQLKYPFCEIGKCKKSQKYHKRQSFERRISPQSISPNSYSIPRKSSRLNLKPHVRYSDVLSDSLDQSTFIEPLVTTKNQKNNAIPLIAAGSRLRNQSGSIYSTKNSVITLDTESVSSLEVSINADEIITDNNSLDAVTESNPVVHIEKNASTHFDRLETKASRNKYPSNKVLLEQMENTNTLSSESSVHSLISLERSRKLNVSNRVLGNVRITPCNDYPPSDFPNKIMSSNTKTTSVKFTGASVSLENNVSSHHKDVDSVNPLCRENSYTSLTLDRHLEINRGILAIAQTIKRPWTVRLLLKEATELYPAEDEDELTARIIHIVSVSHTAVDYLIGYSLDSSNLPGKNFDDSVHTFYNPPITHGVSTGVVDSFLNGSTYVKPMPHAGHDRTFELTRDVSKAWTRASLWAIKCLENERPPFHATSFERLAGNDTIENTKVLRLSAISLGIDIFKYVARELTRNLILFKDNSVNLTPMDFSLLTRVRRSNSLFDL